MTSKTATKKTSSDKPRHIVPVAGGTLRPDLELAECRDCPVSCQSACKTSCTVGNQRCPKE